MRPSLRSMSRPAGCAARVASNHPTAMPGRRVRGPTSSSFTASAFRPANSADRGSTGCSPTRCHREAHPYFATIADRQVSAHLLIDRHGRITQYVPFQERAWHAGPSSYEGRTACNDFSIGIELEGTDSTPYEDAQYVALARVVCALCEAYPDLKPTRLAAHSDIAPGRKTDPGPSFDWPRLKTLIALEQSSSPGY